MLAVYGVIVKLSYNSLLEYSVDLVIFREEPTSSHSTLSGWCSVTILLEWHDL